MQGRITTINRYSYEIQVCSSYDEYVRFMIINNFNGCDRASAHNEALALQARVKFVKVVVYTLKYIFIFFNIFYHEWNVECGYCEVTM